MTGEELDEDTIISLFEAARRTPSSYNNQPWRFIYAKRNTFDLDLSYTVASKREGFDMNYRIGFDAKEFYDAQYPLKKYSLH